MVFVVAGGGTMSFMSWCVTFNAVCAIAPPIAIGMNPGTAIERGLEIAEATFERVVPIRLPREIAMIT